MAGAAALGYCQHNMIPRHGNVFGQKNVTKLDILSFGTNVERLSSFRKEISSPKVLLLFSIRFIAVGLPCEFFLAAVVVVVEDTPTCLDQATYRTGLTTQYYTVLLVYICPFTEKNDAYLTAAQKALGHFKRGNVHHRRCRHSICCFFISGSSRRCPCLQR